MQAKMDSPINWKKGTALRRSARILQFARWAALVFVAAVAVWRLLTPEQVISFGGRTPELTIYTSPKDFDKATESVITSQRNAINSWLAMVPTPRVVLFTKAPVPEDIASHPHVEVLSTFRENKYGTPLVSSMFNIACTRSRTKYIAYVNTDIILSGDLPEVIAAADRLISDKFLLVGQRCSTTIDHPVKMFSAGFFNRKRKECKLDPTFAIDYFIFTKEVFGRIPDFALGRMVWDQWLLHEAVINDIALVDATQAVLALHQTHDYAHIRSGDTVWEVGAAKTYSGEELEENRLLGRQRWYLGQTTLANYYAMGGGVILDKGAVLRKYTKMAAGKGEEKGDGVTMVWIGTLEMAEKLLDIVKTRWTGPMAVLLIVESEWKNNMETTMADVKEMFGNEDRIAVEIIFAHDVGSGSLNSLRNFMLAKVTTAYAFVLDSGLVPSTGLYEYLMKGYSNLQQKAAVCYTLPVFGRNEPAIGPLPETKQELMDQWAAGNIFALDDSLRPHHWPADHQRWGAAEQSYDVSYHYLFEAQCVMLLAATPLYDGTHATDGFERAAYTFALSRLGVAFVILRDHFLVDIDRTNATNPISVPWQEAFDNYIIDFSALP